jgi:hypothetical protein
MMDTPLLEDRHRELAALVDRFNRERVREVTPGEGEGEKARRLVHALAGEGLLDYTAPAGPGAGAKDIDVRALCVARERLSYESSLADLMFAMQGLGSYPLGRTRSGVGFCPGSGRARPSRRSRSRNRKQARTCRPSKLWPGATAQAT